MTSNHRVISIC